MGPFLMVRQKESVMITTKTRRRGLSQTVAGMAASLALLSGCATDGESIRTDSPRAATLHGALAEANGALVAGQRDKAQTLLKSAAASYPADKAPWLQLAQLKFERGNYGEAIVNALEALQRDPKDKLGNSIVAVSGLRLSTKALADLSQQNNLSGSLRTEAQELAKLLRNSLGEDVLVPSSSAAAAAAAARRAASPASGKKAATSVAPAKGSQSSDPFGGLK
jgi:tetratricopeptide (TPR) repeat protein